VEVAMQYVRSAANSPLQKRILDEVDMAFTDFLNRGAGRDGLSALLFRTIGGIQPLERIEAILATLELPIPEADESTTYVASDGVTQRRKTRPWTHKEDMRLLAGIHKEGMDNWVGVANFVGNGRTRAQCAQRWFRGLDPRICKDQWTSEEEEKLFKLLQDHGLKGWTAIASEMGNRSDVQCRYHYLQMKRTGRIASGFPDLMPRPLTPTLPKLGCLALTPQTASHTAIVNMAVDPFAIRMMQQPNFQFANPIGREAPRAASVPRIIPQKRKRKSKKKMESVSAPAKEQKELPVVWAPNMDPFEVKEFDSPFEFWGKEGDLDAPLGPGV
jgi:hypothetical protein